MGWAGGTEAFDHVADQLVREVSLGNVTEGAAERIAKYLIQALQHRGWDTEGESLGEYQHLPWMVDAFKFNEVYLSCEVTAELDTVDNWVLVACSLPRGHLINHYDEEEGLEWEV